jgi:hypothetical protein
VTVIAFRPKTTCELVKTRPSSLIINPEPMTELTRLVTLKGSMDTAEINTTAGETRWKSSGICSAQLGLAITCGIPIIVAAASMRIEMNKPLM